VPWASVAAVAARIVCPTSFGTSLYDESVAPAIGVHVPLSQRCHWIDVVIGVRPTHGGCTTLSDSPERGEPAPSTVGGVVENGGAAVVA
jgi:hypothetical protein